MTELAVRSDAPEKGIQIAQSEIDRRRAAMDADVWLFVKWVCGHGADDLAKFHRPLAYMFAGDAKRLAACLNLYDSELVTQLKAELARREINWNSFSGVKKLGKLLRRVNNRISRSMGKTSIGLDVVLWKASVDPDRRILIASKSDDAAWAMCEDVGNLMRTPAYKLYYGDRFNEEWITKKWIRMVGRTVTVQDTIEARGVTSQSYSKHYTDIYMDDMTSTEAKQGEATVEDAVRFMASLHGISLSDRFGGTNYGINGTIQGPKDDHSKLVGNPEFLSIVIPIWKHPSGKWSVKNMMEDGIPVLPEMYDEEAIKQKRADTIANDSLGKISWLQNFLMCAHESGSMTFTAELLVNQFFTWVTTTSGRRLIRRYLYEKDGSPKRTTDKAKAPCRCWRKCGLDDHDYIQFDPLDVPRALGVDQAISETGDQWSVGAAAIDSFGHKYQLKGAYDKGYWKMAPGIAMVFDRWGGLNNPPFKIGIESNTWQAMSADWLKRSEDLQYLARRIEKLPPARTAKVTRIYNDIYAGAEDGTLWFDPEDSIFQQCALDYNAANPDKQWDDPLDGVAMAIQTHKRAAVDMNDETMKALVQSQERNYEEDSTASYWTTIAGSGAGFMEGLSWS